MGIEIITQTGNLKKNDIYTRKSQNETFINTFS